MIPADIRRHVQLSLWRKDLKSLVLKSVIIMKPLRKLSELEGILSEMEKESKEVVGELRKEWDLKLEDLSRA